MTYNDESGDCMVINGNIKSVNQQISGNVNGNGMIIGNASKATNIYIKEVYFDNRFGFPSIGNDNMIYVAKDEHKSYIFNTNTLTYEIIGSDYTEIDIIQGIL